MFQILISVAPLFLIIFASAFLQKFKNVGENWAIVLNDFALKIGLPVLIFSVLAKTNFSFAAEMPLIISNSIFLLVGFVLALLLGKFFKLSKQNKLTLFICFAFGNVAYLGIPVLTQISGDQVLPTVSLIIAVYFFWLFSLGIGYLNYSIDKSRKNAIKHIFTNFVRNPLLLSVFFGLVVGGFNIPLPAIVMKSLDMVSASVTPVVLVVIGLFIGTSKIGKISEWTSVLSFSVLILILLPAGFYFTIKLLGLAPAQFSTSIIEAAMPLAITPFALADRYKLNKVFIARAIVLSTILSVLSLPFWISIL